MKARLKNLAPWALVILVLAGTPAVSAAPPKKPRVVAILSTNAKHYQDHLDRFKLRFSGKVEKEILPKSTARLERKLKKNPPDLILALGSSAARFAKDAGLSSPVLFSMVYDPEKHGLAAGGSVCGIAMKVSPEKTLDALEAVWPGPAPKIRVGALSLKGAEDSELDSIRRALEDRGHSLVVQNLSSPDELEAALDRLLPGVDALWLLMAPELISNQQNLDLLLERAMDRKVAVVGISDHHARIGALLAVSADYYLEGDHAARLAKKIIQGADPEDVGVRPPENIIWSLNLKVAKEIGWEIPAMNRKRFEKVYP